MPRSVILINLLSQGLRTDGEQGEVVVSPSTSIFISHVNSDQEAEEVLQALVAGLKNELGPSHDGYELAYDREIIAGKEWRRRDL